MADSAELLNPASLWAISDFVVHDGREAPPQFRIDPPTVNRFVGRLRTVRDGAIVCVKANLCHSFFAIAFPHLRARIVLLTVEGDWPAPGPHRDALDDDRIICWFGQNCDLEVPHPSCADADRRRRAALATRQAARAAERAPADAGAGGQAVAGPGVVPPDTVAS